MESIKEDYQIINKDMKKYIITASAIVLVPTAIFAYSWNSINSQVTALPPSNLQPQVVVQDSAGSQAYQTIKSFDPVATVPQGVYIAHVINNTQTIDVQRFIDVSTNVACYYSELGSTVVGVNCVSIPANAK